MSDEPVSEPTRKMTGIGQFVRRRWLTVLMVGGIGLWVTVINLPREDFGSRDLDMLSGVSIAADGSSAPFTAKVVYSPGYLISLGGLERVHPFDIRKYEKIHNQLIAEGVLTTEATFSPESIEVDDILLVHTKAYVDSLSSRKSIANYLEAPVLRWAPVSLDRAVLSPFRRASGGTLLASRLALEYGVGINIGGGYHHAKPDTGEGFCIYADIAIAIRRLQSEGMIDRAVVIDVDAHQGNGTAECLANDDSTFTFSMHQGDIYPLEKSKSDLDIELEAGTDDAKFLEQLENHLDPVLDKANADICFVVAGCDTLATDPLAQLMMTPEGVVLRDAMIVRACVSRRIPVVFTLSGGYSPDAWKTQYQSIRKLLETYSD